MNIAPELLLDLRRDHEALDEPVRGYMREGRSLSPYMPGQATIRPFPHGGNRASVDPIRQPVSLVPDRLYDGLQAA